MSPDAATLRWHLADLAPLAETATSCLWRATSPDFGSVVLKVLKPYGADEIHGIRLLEALIGTAAVRVFGVAGNAILMEALAGPTLGDLVRQGRDDEASAVLADLAARIHQTDAKGLVPLEDHLGVLIRRDQTDLPSGPALRAAARDLIASSPDPRPLHGDLHHDNVLNGARGWLAIDPKGLVGDPAFDVANAFRNPFDCQALARDPDRIKRLARVFEARLAVPEARVLKWAAVLCATSMLWDRAAGNSTADDMALLPVLLSVAEIG